MGAGASSHTTTPSSLNRLRKALVMRAYNIRKSDETLDELFRPRAYRAMNGVYISVETIKKTLSEDAPWIDLLFEQMVGKDVGDLEFHSFIHFLETGNKPITMDASQIRQKQLPNKQSIAQKNHHKARPPTDLPPSRNKKNGTLPPSPPRFNIKSSPSSINSINSKLNNISTYIPPFNAETSSIYPGTIAALHLHTLAIGIHSGAVVPSSGLTIALDYKSGYRNPNRGPTRPLWRKREIVTQERTVEYTTIDADGVTQELTEKEITTTEVLHMECRETGEFAHRETTNYEQTETFNDELVAEEKGNEEYVHMKSVDDEYEFLDSNMPKKEAPPEPEPDMDPGTPQGTPFTPGSGGRGREFDDEYQQHSPDSRREHMADSKDRHVQNTPMHDLSVSDDEDDRRGGERYDNHRHDSPDNRRNNFRRGASGTSSGNKFDDNNEEDSPAATPGGLWQSMGENTAWIPPPGTDYESELLNDRETEIRANNSHSPLASDSDEAYFSAQQQHQRPPVGVRRPDLFAPTSSSEDKQSSSHNNINNNKKNYHKNNINSKDRGSMEDEEEDGNSEDGQGEGLESRFQSSDDLSPRDRYSRPTSRQGSRRTSRDHDDYNPALGQTEETLTSNMFRSDSNDPIDHTSMFKPDFSNDGIDDDRGGNSGGSMHRAPPKYPADNNDITDNGQDILFTNTETSASLSAKWGSEDDID